MADRELAKEAWMEAKKQEATTTQWDGGIHERTAESQFERWWTRNYE